MCLCVLAISDEGGRATHVTKKSGGYSDFFLGCSMRENALLMWHNNLAMFADRFEILVEHNSNRQEQNEWTLDVHQVLNDPPFDGERRI